MSANLPSGPYFNQIIFNPNFLKVVVQYFNRNRSKLLAEKNDKIEFVNDVDEIPSLEEFDDETKKKPKLIICDVFLSI